MESNSESFHALNTHTYTHCFFNIAEIFTDEPWHIAREPVLMKIAYHSRFIVSILFLDHL